MSELSAESIPDEISKQLGPYLKRSIELEDFKPIVSYYCKFYITEYIINNKLHLSSPDVSNFTLLLLDNMELCKSKLSEEDLLIMQDTESSYRHVEEFALSVFHKGYLDIINHTTTKSTIGVLKSSIEFMTILKYWGEPLKPTVQKNIVYAKFHISRILKAYRSNQDPNDYMTPEDKDLEKDLDHELSELSLQKEQKSVSPEPPKDGFPSPPKFIDPHHHQVDLPKPPSFIDNESDSALPQPPTFISDAEETSHPLPVSPLVPVDSELEPKPRPNSIHEVKKTTKQDIKNILSTEERISKTQKHCKFAISALNYEDIETAKLELRRALELLESSGNE